MWIKLVGLTGFTDNIGSYPTVNQLINLATRVKTILGYNTLITYAADWSEYHHTEGGWFNLDPLWTSPNIDFIGIDAYFPLTEDLPQRQITENLINDGWQSGEGWQYYYDHTRSIRHYFSDGKYAWKNLEYWWSNYHQNPNGNYTTWQPKIDFFRNSTSAGNLCVIPVLCSSRTFEYAAVRGEVSPTNSSA